jgi:Flp pilus assembly protein TadD
MKRATRSFSTLATVGGFALASLLTANTAMAEYRVTAFGHTMGYSDLITTDLKAIQTTFGKKSLSNLDYSEANNLCVAQILLKDFDAAVTSCEAAVVKADRAFEISPSDIDSVKASIYSNMGVAKALAGNDAEASKDLELALKFNARNRNAIANYSQLSMLENLTAGNG